MQRDLHVCQFLPPHSVMRFYVSTTGKAGQWLHTCVMESLCGWVCVLSDVQPMTPQGGEAKGRPICTWLITPTWKCVRNHLATNSINFTFPRGYLQATQPPFRSPIKRRDIWIWVLVNLFTYVFSLSLRFLCPWRAFLHLHSNSSPENSHSTCKSCKRRCFVCVFLSISWLPFQHAWFHLLKAAGSSVSNMSWNWEAAMS